MKVRKVFGTETNDYLDGFQYVNSTLKFFPTAEGFYSFTENRYIYQYRDHLGNARISFAKNSEGVLEVTDTNNYYPFGLNHIEGMLSSSNFGGYYSYKYNGKELQETGMYDYGARFYMPDIGRWGVVDPLAEKMPSWSPYAYAFNNPIKFIDPTGMEPTGDIYSKSGKYLGWDGKNDQKVYVIDDNKYRTDSKGVNHFAKKDLRELKGITGEVFLGFASAIHRESDGDRMESLAIGNVTMNYLGGGGSRDLQTLEDIVMYDNSFAQGATQKDFSNFLNLSFGDRNSKFAIESAINAYGYSQGMSGFQDYSNGANAWDGTDLIFSTWPNSHRNYTWSTSSQGLLTKFKNDNGGAVDVSKFKYSPTNYDISATKILGGTLYENITGGRGERIQNRTRFNYRTK